MPEEPSVIATSDQTPSDQTTDETARAIAEKRQEPPPPVKTYYPPGRSRRWRPENA